MKVNELEYVKQSDEPEPLWLELGVFYDGPFHDGGNEYIVTCEDRKVRLVFEPSIHDPRVVRLESQIGELHDYEVLERYSEGGLLLRGPYGDPFYLRILTCEGWAYRFILIGLDPLMYALRQGNVARKQEG